MDGIHDLGGKQGFGTIDRNLPEKAFAARWEAAVFTMTRTARSCGALQNTDQFRFAVERIDPVAYLTHSYYGRWLGAVENLLVEARVVSSEELAERVVASGGDADALIAARPDPALGPIAAETASGARRPVSAPPLHELGQRVQTAAAPSSGHTRLPAYARSRCGVIRALHEVWVLPDSNAHGAGEQPEHLYTVEFSGEELWGAGAEPGTRVCLDLFESYLSAADLKKGNNP
jgi:nitrile hydratase